MTTLVEDIYNAAPVKQVIYENTYKTQEDYGREARFNSYSAQQLIKGLLEERLEGLTYDSVKGSQLVKQLADDIREKVKNLGYERHKLIVQVEIGEKKGQAINLVSRCLWDTATDGFASVVYESETLFCNCQVYALYFE